MRLFNFVKMLVAAVLMTTVFTACDEDVSVAVYGTVIAFPSTVSNGDEIVLRIGNSTTIVAASSAGIFGGGSDCEDPIKAISYYIDDNLIVTSSDKDNSYSATYTIQNLSPGTHTVSARCEFRSDDYETNEQIRDAQITVNQ